MDDARTDCALLEEHEDVRTLCYIDSRSSCLWPAIGCGRAFLYKLSNRLRIHVVLEVDRLDVTIETEFGVINDVTELLLRTNPAGQRRMIDHAYAATDELVKLAEAAVRTHRRHDRDLR